MHSPSNAYAKNARNAATGRELETMVLLSAAVRLRHARDALSAGDRQPLEDALLSNKKLWAVLMAEVADDANPLPIAIKQNVLSLGQFVLRRTIEVLGVPRPERMDVLIQINQDLASGLAGKS